MKEEEAHIRSYLQIQQFRYQDILQYSIDISEELYEYQILKLTLQPLVENALYHGIKNKRGLGHIRVIGRFDEAEGTLKFTVQDDGRGMTAEELAEVKKGLTSEEKADASDLSGFGLQNVAMRMRLNYGPQYGITIKSTYGEGTEMTVTIPAVKK